MAINFTESDLHNVQSLIERCLKLKMSQMEVVNTLFNNALIEPWVTQLVWKRLKKENQKFFRVYNKKLVMDYVLHFNQLRKIESTQMHQNSMSYTAGASSSTQLSNGIQTHSTYMNSDQQPYKPSMESENMCPVLIDVPHVSTNGTCPQQQPMSGYAGGGMDCHTHMPLVQNSNAGMMQGFNETTPFNGGTDPQQQPMLGYAGVGMDFHAHMPLVENSNVGMMQGFNETTPFNGGDSCFQSFNGYCQMETEMNSFGAEKLTRNLSISDFPVDNGTDNCYSFVPGVTNTNSHMIAEDQGVTRLETMSEDFSYDDFFNFN